MNDSKVLGQEKVGKHLFKYALPCGFLFCLALFYNVVDQLFIGNSAIGYMGNVATTVVFPLTILCLALALFDGRWSIGLPFALPR